MPNPSVYFMTGAEQTSLYCAPGGLAVARELSPLRGIADGSTFSLVDIVDSTFQTYIVWDCDVTEHDTIDGAVAPTVKLDTFGSSGFFLQRFRVLQIRKSDCVAVATSAWSSEFGSEGIHTQVFALTWDKDVPSLLRVEWQFRRAGPGMAAISIRLRDNDSQVSIGWDAFGTFRVKQIGYEAMKRVQDIAGLADARIDREKTEVQQLYPAAHLVDAGWEDRHHASLGDGPNLNESSAVLIFKLYTNDGDPIFGPLLLAKKVATAIEGGTKNLGLPYVVKIETPELVPLGADFEAHKAWGIAAQAFRVVYRAARGIV